MNKIITLLACSALTGCASYYDKPMTGPNNRPAWQAACSYTSWNDCYAQADKRCPSGYDILHIVDEREVAGQYRIEQTLPVITVPRRQLTYQCLFNSDTLARR